MPHRGHTARAALAAAFLVATLPRAATGQTSHASVEVGAARLRQRGIQEVHAATAGATFRYDGSRYALAAAGGVTFADDGRSTSQGLAAVSLLGRPGGRTRWEIGGAVTAFDQGVFPLTAGAYLLAREHFAIGRFGGWAGAAIGGVEEVNYWSPTRTAELGSWYSTRLARFTAAATFVDTRSEPYESEAGLVTDPVTYTDGSIGARWSFRRRAELETRGGVRFISRGALTPSGRGTRPFASVDAAVWVTPQIALVAAAGRQLADLSRGTPDTRFAALALRFSVRSPPAPPPRARRLPTRASVRPRLTLMSDTTGRTRLVVAALGDDLVEIAASFTDWEPIALVRSGDHWELDRVVPSGAHRVLLRINRGPWIVPANLPSTADDFGGTVGILTVP